MSTAYKAGWNAWLTGKCHNDNPYRDNKQAAEWDAGFEAACHAGF